MLQVKHGEARVEGQYGLEIVFVQLMQEEEREAARKDKSNEQSSKQVDERDKEEQFFSERKLGTITVDTGTVISAVKQKIFDELIKGKEGMCDELKIQTVDDFRLRNAKNSDLGGICKAMTKDGDESMIDEQGLWDNKIFYVQKAEH